MRQPPLTSTTSYQALQSHAQDAQQWQMRDLFAQDPQRFERLSAEAAGLFLDYSKNRLDGRTLALLANLARERGVEQLRDAMFAGDKINLTEQRAVLHTALRAPKDKQITVDGQDITADVHAVLARVKTFSDAVRNGAWLGHTGKEITDIVNIGIGGSDLGPKMVCLALRQFAHPRLTMHFVSNVDGHDMDAALARVNPETTLFIIASKTFTTAETMMNANTARSWFLKHASEEALAKHFVAVSTNVEAIKKFGIDPDNMFPFWDWVGGRYSVWSAIGLPVALCVGYGYFADFLAGAHALDEHFRTAPIEQNLPMILALVGFWNREFLGCPSVSIAPYHQDLNRFPAYLQQLDMESNGKRVTRAGDTITDYATGPVIWGDVGTNGQHAYFQLLHQGTDVTPMDFIAALRPAHEFQNHHAALLANCFAQSEAFMKGKTADEVRQDLAGQDPAEIERLVPHKTFPGNRPSNTILMEYLTPATLGALIALYEHKVFVQGAIWDVNSYDQWGVELGKVLAKKIEAELNGEAQPAQHDGSTNGLIARARAAV
ncbi:glucose-6-phosphate isomerase [Massilia sp. Root133]|uniref:Glucose-6-phosphate isomerase n=1 Tax=Massilia cellulosiltytica TaxID=2683234 RepID=A0A7X3G3V9_9BURK|nr:MULTISPECIES: glucose-6-phosphate isomerase [Telluria group]KQX96799.1 glucose-6-phosphate isomerase [Massilia sp. Root133]KQZ52509.1 glucose-6-phosphate isomerase [Massilia sp. Root1485]MVW63158.1 glucose-6-phosphate isomerase [Telluria cellulosilytica]